MDELKNPLIDTQSDDTLVVMNATIVSAKHFNSSNTCVCFYIESNNNWIFVNDLNKTSFYGSTQKCWTNSEDMALFSTPFQIQMRFNSSVFNHLKPILYLKVLSFDYWNRLVSESYGFVELPVRTGRHSMVVNTWKPFTDSRLERMKQFFIGFTPLIQNLHKESTQLSTKSLNNYGLQSETSGSVAIDLSVVLQTEIPEVLNKNKYKTKNSLKFDSIKQNILSVVLAFQRARNRMDLIRSELNINQL